jgi:dihydroflavonol-4-reductase
MQEHAVMVSGASGFIAKHCIVQLLQAGYAVHGTVRDASQFERVRRSLARHADIRKLTMYRAELDHELGWREAARGCRFVLHIASPLPHRVPRNPRAMIASAREGTLRVLRASLAEGVARVVMTSSVSAVIGGQRRGAHDVYGEQDWSRLEAEVSPYERSKTLAERAAWGFHREHASALELVTILPGMVLGPLLDAHGSASSELVRKLCAGEVPGVPALRYSFVDVRDVASCHLAAMLAPGASGRRYICAGAEAEVGELARVLAPHFPRVSTRKLPDWLVRLFARFDGATGLVVHELGKSSRYCTDAARTELGFAPRSLSEMTLAMANTLVEFGALQPPRSTLRSLLLAPRSPRADGRVDR